MAGSASWSRTINKGTRNPFFDVITCSYTTDASAGNVKSSSPYGADGMLWKTTIVPTLAHTANFETSVRDADNCRLAFDGVCTGTVSTPTTIQPIYCGAVNCVRGTFSVEVTNAGNSKTGKVHFYFGPPSDFENVPVEVPIYFSNVGNETNNDKTTYTEVSGFPPSYIAEIVAVNIHHASGTVPTTYQAQLWTEKVDTYGTYNASTYSAWKLSDIGADDEFRYIDSSPFVIQDHTASYRLYGGIKITGATTDDDYMIVAKMRLLGHDG